jgi:hypothetical protein
VSCYSLIYYFLAADLVFAHILDKSTQNRIDFISIVWSEKGQMSTESPTVKEQSIDKIMTVGWYFNMAMLMKVNSLVLFFFVPYFLLREDHHI